MIKINCKNVAKRVIKKSTKALSRISRKQKIAIIAMLLVAVFGIALFTNPTLGLLAPKAVQLNLAPVLNESTATEAFKLVYKLTGI